MKCILKPVSFVAASLMFSTVTSAQAAPRIDLLGSPSPPAAAEYTIVIHPDTKHVNVTGGDTVKFIAGNQAFAWSFNVGKSVLSFDLNRVAPPGMLDHQVTAYVDPDPRYTGF